MTSPQFVTWLEDKLLQAGVKKVVPDEATLTAAYRRAWQLAAVQEAMRRTMSRVEKQAQALPIPPGLRERIAAEIAETETPWDDALFEIACADRDDGAGA